MSYSRINSPESDIEWNFHKPKYLSRLTHHRKKFVFFTTCRSHLIHNSAWSSNNTVFYLMNFKNWGGGAEENSTMGSSDSRHAGNFNRGRR
nr:hypothetical protein Iba_chr02bCG18770 [Ipomoea batatas]